MSDEQLFNRGFALFAFACVMGIAVASAIGLSCAALIWSWAS